MTTDRDRYQEMRERIRSLVNAHDTDVIAIELVVVREHAKAYEAGDGEAVCRALERWSNKNLVKWAEIYDTRQEIFDALASGDDLALAVELTCLRELALANLEGAADAATIVRLRAAEERWQRAQAKFFARCSRRFYVTGWKV